MENLKITLIQPNIVWENTETNLVEYSKSISESVLADVIILPEMFTTGFTMAPEKLKETMHRISVEWMKNTARTKNAAVTGSLIIEENSRIFNRAIWAFPDGNVEFYDKKHLFTMGEEDLHYSAGKKKLIVEFRGWKFCPLVCYDLRFPVWSRNTENYDVLIYMANWPAPRHHVWKNLLVARAIENQSYCIGVNRVGTDGNGIEYLGDSAVIYPKGHGDFLGEGEQVKTFEISRTELYDFRKSFPVLNDMDKFKLLVNPQFS